MRGHSPRARLLLEKAQWATATARSLPKLRAPEMDGDLVAHECGALYALLVACWECLVRRNTHGSSRQRVRAVLTTPHRSRLAPSLGAQARQHHDSTPAAVTARLGTSRRVRRCS